MSGETLPQTDEGAILYLPPCDEAVSLYRLRRKQGYSIINAIIRVLEVFSGEAKNEEMVK